MQYRVAYKHSLQDTPNGFIIYFPSPRDESDAASARRPVAVG